MLTPIKVGAIYKSKTSQLCFIIKAKHNNTVSIVGYQNRDNFSVNLVDVHLFCKLLSEVFCDV